MRRIPAAAAILLAASIVVEASPSRATPVPDAPACPMLPADNVWHADISGLPVHAQSNTYVNSMGSNGIVHADFGSGQWDGGPIGIPYVVVPGSQPGVSVSFTWPDESDPGPYPIPANPPIEGGPNSHGDRHILMVDRDNCMLYELFAAYPKPSGTGWKAGSGAIYDMNSNALRPSGWTSADAAGLPMLPGLVTYDEVASGFIDHAIRMTAEATQDTFIWPARHEAGDHNTSLPPMGLRLRLHDDFDISGFSPKVQVILQALKTYGAIIADNGTSWYISGVPDPRWDNDELHELDVVEGSDFEAINESSLMVDPNSGQVVGGGTPTLSVNDRSGSEANGALKFTVRLSSASASPVQVRIGSSNGSATAGSDFTAVDRIVKFKPGKTARSVSVVVSNDGSPEADETFTLTLSAPSGATIADATATGTILNDD